MNSSSLSSIATAAAATSSTHHLLGNNAAFIHAPLQGTSDCPDELRNFELQRGSVLMWAA
jgi:hypothetical protein